MNNLYQLHNNPESLYKYSEAIKIPIIAYEIAKSDPSRRKEVEPVIMKDPELAVKYAIEVLEDRFKKAEPYIMKDPKYAYYYAYFVLKGRWKEAEPYIMKDPKYAYYYARFVLKGRFKETEPYIMKDPKYAYRYSEYILHRRWKEAEPYIMKDPEIWEIYKNYFNIKETKMKISEIIRENVDIKKSIIQVKPHFGSGKIIIKYRLDSSRKIIYYSSEYLSKDNTIIIKYEWKNGEKRWTDLNKNNHLIHENMSQIELFEEFGKKVAEDMLRHYDNLLSTNDNKGDKTLSLIKQIKESNMNNVHSEIQNEIKPAMDLLKWCIMNTEEYSEKNKNITENNNIMKLKDVANIKTNFPDADFWIIRKGSEDKVGTPTKEYSPEHIGVKITNTDEIYPDYMYYALQYVQMQGYFKLVSKGTLRLKHISISDVGNIPLQSSKKETKNFGYKDVDYKMNKPKFK